MSVRRLPVRPDLDQLHRQAKDLLRDIQAGDATAIELRELHPESIDPTTAKLADAQLVLARSSRRNPALIREHVLIRTDSDWRLPMTYPRTSVAMASSASCTIAAPKILNRRRDVPHSRASPTPCV